MLIFVRDDRMLFLCIAFVLAFLHTSFLSAQENSPTQTVKGSIYNARTQQPLAGATVQILTTKLGAVSTPNGSFKISKVPVGRYDIRISAIGYEPVIRNIVLNSGKEEDLKVELIEQVLQMEEVVVSGSKGSFTPINEAALVSSAVFSVDDVDRYAGSRGDPARMAQNFAGVLGASDNRNDIIIRGGSPAELLWRLDGLDIPNPNHFATQGATGGPISALNSNLLDNSDFITGAFPAEYGDKVSGVFDLRTRKGNNEKYEYLGQFGFNGFEVMAEGPFPGVQGSFMLNYRKSFLDIMEKLGIHLNFAGIPKYQDATLKVDLSATDRDQISLTGLYGTSDIFIENSKLDSVYTGDMNIRNGTDIASFGLNWQHLFSEHVYGKLLIGTVYGKYHSALDSITTDGNNHVLGLTPWWNSASTEGYHTMRYSLYYSPDTRHYFSGGTEARYRYYKLYEERLTPSPDAHNGARYRIDASGSALQTLHYLNWNWRITEELTSNVGVHMQYLSISKQVAVEPRVSLAWNVAPRHSFTAGISLHSQSQPLLLYFGAPGDEHLDFTRAVHYVMGYTFRPFDDVLLKVEGYYKQLFHAPVERDSATAYSFLNAGVKYGSVSTGLALQSTGKGKTYGAELSLFKHFSNGYYITMTGSLVRQEYTGSDGVWRFGAFDNRFIANVLAGYEWKITSGFSIEFSGKYTIAGGALYTPIDLEKSRLYHETRYDVEHAYSQRNPLYARLDGRIDFRQNFQSVSIISFFSIENILDRRNIQERIYRPQNDDIEVVSQLGFFPVGGVKVEF